MTHRIAMLGAGTGGTLTANGLRRRHPDIEGGPCHVPRELVGDLMTFEQLPAVEYTGVCCSKADWVRQPGYKMLRERPAFDGSPDIPWGSYAKSCPECRARFIPSQFDFCGRCGKVPDEDVPGFAGASRDLTLKG
jgi:hypothetical protein